MASALLRYAWTLFVVVFVVGSAPGQRPEAGEYSSADYGVVEARNERVEMRDGAKLVVDVFRPNAEGRFPAVLCQTPYNRKGLLLAAPATQENAKTRAHGAHMLQRKTLKTQSVVAR